MLRTFAGVFRAIVPQEIEINIIRDHILLCSRARMASADCPGARGQEQSCHVLAVAPTYGSFDSSSGNPNSDLHGQDLARSRASRSSGSPTKQPCNACIDDAAERPPVSTHAPRTAPVTPAYNPICVGFFAKKSPAPDREVQAMFPKGLSPVRSLLPVPCCASGSRRELPRTGACRSRQLTYVCTYGAR